MDRDLAEVKTTCDQACEILRRTRDGDDLDPGHLKLVELAVNGFLSDDGKQAFQDLHAMVMKGEYVKPWFHGIEHLTIDHKGRVYWKGYPVEHFSYPVEMFEESKAAATETARRCQALEGRGVQPSTKTVVWEWEE